jgi:hypothetical protein
MKKFILFIPFLLLFPQKNYGQFWPVTPMVRYSSITYYKLEYDKPINLTKPHAIFDKNLENRFFDILTVKDSIGIKLDGKVIFFKQKSRREPGSEKVVPFYSRRFFRNQNSKIKYLEIKEIQDNIIVAEATIKHKNRNKGRKKQLVEIDIADLKGVFIGPGENQRAGHYILGWGAGLAAGIFVFSR